MQVELATGGATLLGDSDGSGRGLVEVQDPHGCDGESRLEVTSGLSPPPHQVISYPYYSCCQGGSAH